MYNVLVKERYFGFTFDCEPLKDRPKMIYRGWRPTTWRTRMAGRV